MAAAGEWRVMAPAKQHRRRILCPTLPSSEDRCTSLPRVMPGGPSMNACGQLQEQRQSGQKRTRSLSPERKTRSPGIPVALGIRVMYFSRDGAQADNGQLLEFEVLSDSTVDALLSKAREAAGVGNKGKLLFKMRPLTDLAATIEEAGILRDPQGLHLMLSRKYRTAEVADRAATVAAELSVAMAQAAAEAAARPPRRKRSQRPPSGGSQASGASQ
mmetsp:Transcript_28794/g.72319  ORF Transcript_28794/g.72319 Transcript_28794/m.72319 type:complete len:216 (+) Transcript_28794:99-746(+)|eukprot:CAMPEP_0115182570 /NCGR_PEP_ID=MMETSP0270-20121206/8011_1 /TAXON_ID=71861 /ORGANISM="Scrippsiella trochoidea, Strain CCMP3099" /LENGTH=215 /DNA_ID=CAMNT_0002595621 /DNA_START=27 /DNA_END=674 /DNA_ORIENTATION=-